MNGKELILRAQEFATHAHKRIDHRRKYTQAPYVVHLAATVKLVASVTDAPAVLAAAWLHDTVEDTPATVRDIESEFGTHVASLVLELTDVSKPSDGNRAARKAIDHAHLARASAEAKTVKLADLINNCTDITRHDARFARTFLSEMATLLEVLKEGHPKLYALAQKTHTRCASRLGLNGVLSAAELSDDHRDSTGPLSSMLPSMFVESFSARDVLSPLISFDQDVPASEALALLQVEDEQVAGVRREGRIVGYVEEGDLVGDRSGDSIRAIEAGQTVEEDSALVDLVQVLTRRAFCFTTSAGNVTGVVARDDMNKPVVRMWLFGIVTIIEMYLTESIKSLHADDAWQSLLSRSRLEKALSLYNERRRRGRGGDLADCLQISDKVQILVKDAEFMQSLGFESMNQAKQSAKDLESLRNNLAHGQDIVTSDWAQIVRLARQVEGITLPIA